MIYTQSAIPTVHCSGLRKSFAGVSTAETWTMALVALKVPFTIGHPQLISELKVEDS